MDTLVFHHGALGDSILLWPLLRGLGQGCKAGNKVGYVGPTGQTKLAAKWIDQIEPIDGTTPNWSRLFAPAAIFELPDDLRSLLANAKRIISFISSGHDVWAKNVQLIAPDAEHAYLKTKPGDGDQPQSVLDFYLQQLDQQQLTIKPVMPRRLSNIDGPVVIHPGSGGVKKCWSAERFTQLFAHFESMGRAVVILVGEVERALMEPLVWASWSHRYEMVEPVDLIALSQQLIRAQVYIGNDSGPTHLAAQLGVPTVALFGPTDWRIWGPIGPVVRVLAPPESSSMEWLSVERVIEAAAMW